MLKEPLRLPRPDVCSRRSPLFKALTLTAALFLFGCSHSTKKSAEKAERNIDAARAEHAMREAVEAAGGTDVWIKPVRHGEHAVEILVAHGSYDAVLAAAQKSPLGEGLQSRVESQNAAGGGRRSILRIEAGNQFVTQWMFREVAHIRRAAIIIDDLGEDEHVAQRLLSLPFPLTFSVLPHLPHSPATADAAFRGGREVMLHLPMEPQAGAPASPGPGEIKVGMTGGQVAQLIAGDLASVPHVRGVNNHMGSRATANAAVMAEVMRALAGRNLYFIDSRTTAATTALAAARSAGIPAFYRSVFLDDTETVDYTLGQLRQFRRVVEQNGAAIAIGHPHPSTIAALAQFLPELERDDIQLVPASELVQLPEAARMSPPPAPVARALHQ